MFLFILALLALTVAFTGFVIYFTFEECQGMFGRMATGILNSFKQ